jgi:murein DD-endopeptidase MepM/ murein hydrolase activator NlpD
VIASVSVAPSVHAELRPTAREGAEHAVPLYGELVRPYDAPDDPFAPGHRGIDVAASIGSPVRASADGVVSFAGSVAGNRTVTVDHGEGLLTTYSFLEELRVAQGATVSLGTIVGTVGRGHNNGEPRSHVHLSARRDGVYFDPLELYVGSSYADLVALTA